jgi:hypothetical protein
MGKRSNYESIIEQQQMLAENTGGKSSLTKEEPKNM